MRRMAVTAQSLFNDYFLPLYPTEAARDLAAARTTDANPGKNRAIFVQLTDAARAQDNKWQVIAAGPTTSSREEPYQAEVIEHFKLRGVIGKGGMGAKTAAACQKFGAVYMHAVGGAAVALAEAIKDVVTVHLYDTLGPPEAMWLLRVEDFRGVITIDSKGGSLHKDVLADSKAAAEKYFG